MENTPHPLLISWTSPVEVLNQRCSSIEQDVSGNREHTEQFDRMTKIVQLSRGKRDGRAGGDGRVEGGS